MEEYSLINHAITVGVCAVIPAMLGAVYLTKETVLHRAKASTRPAALEEQAETATPSCTPCLGSCVTAEGMIKRSDIPKDQVIYME